MRVSLGKLENFAKNPAHNTNEVEKQINKTILALIEIAKAAKSLKAEVSGVLSNIEDVLKLELGNTNVTCLKLSLENTKKALKKVEW